MKTFNWKYALAILGGAGLLYWYLKNRQSSAANGIPAASDQTLYNVPNASGSGMPSWTPQVMQYSLGSTPVLAPSVSAAPPSTHAAPASGNVVVNGSTAAPLINVPPGTAWDPTMIPPTGPLGTPSDPQGFTSEQLAAQLTEQKAVGAVVGGETVYYAGGIGVPAGSQPISITQALNTSVPKATSAAPQTVVKSNPPLTGVPPAAPALSVSNLIPKGNQYLWNNEVLTYPVGTPPPPGAVPYTVH